MKRRTLLGLGVLAGISACSPSFPTLRLTIATATTGGVYYKFGTGLAQAWREELHLDTTPVVLSTKGSRENLQRLTGRQADVAFSQIDVAADAALAPTTDPAGPLSPRALARIHDDVVHVVVRADSPIRSLTQLRGTRVGVGDPGSGVSVVAKRVLEAIHLSMTADLRPAYLGVDASISALQNGQIDAFFWSGGLPTPSISTLVDTMSIRLLDFDDVLAGIRPVLPYYAPGTVPAGTYASTAAVTTLFLRNVLLVRAEMADQVAHDLVQALFAAQAGIAQVSPAAQEVNLRAAIGTQPVALHPGAEAYFREARQQS